MQYIFCIKKYFIKICFILVFATSFYAQSDSSIVSYSKTDLKQLHEKTKNYDTNASYKLGVYYHTNEIYKQATFYWKIAAHKGHVQALNALIAYYNKTNQLVLLKYWIRTRYTILYKRSLVYRHLEMEPPSFYPEQSYRQLQKKAKAYDLEALYQLGLYYFDDDKFQYALRLWKTAAHRNHKKSTLAVIAYYVTTPLNDNYYPLSFAKYWVILYYHNDRTNSWFDKNKKN